MLSGPLPSWSGSLLPLESLGSLRYPPSQRGQPRGLLCSPVTLLLCLSHIQGMAENWPLMDKLGSWECFLIFFFFLFPLEPLRRKSGSKTQTFKLQAASQSLRLLSDREHWKASHWVSSGPALSPMCRYMWMSWDQLSSCPWKAETLWCLPFAMSLSFNTHKSAESKACAGRLA